MMNKPNASGIERIVNALKYSVQGIKVAYKNEEAFRQEVWILPLVLFLALYLSQTGIEFVLLFGSHWLVMMCELINSALEAVVDRIGAEKHHLSGQAKDIGSALVMFAIVLTVITWLTIIGFRLVN